MVLGHDSEGKTTKLRFKKKKKKKRGAGVTPAFEPGYFLLLQCFVVCCPLYHRGARGHEQVQNKHLVKTKDHIPAM